MLKFAEKLLLGDSVTTRNTEEMQEHSILLIKLIP